MQNCRFSNNRANNSTKQAIKEIKGGGGAIYYNCDPDYKNCNMFVDGGNLFENNYASIKGGAILWDEVEP